MWRHVQTFSFTFARSDVVLAPVGMCCSGGTWCWAVCVLRNEDYEGRVLSKRRYLFTSRPLVRQLDVSEDGVSRTVLWSVLLSEWLILQLAILGLLVNSHAVRA